MNSNTIPFNCLQIPRARPKRVKFGQDEEARSGGSYRRNPRKGNPRLFPGKSVLLPRTLFTVATRLW
jgi:hypothetical protein